MEVKDVAAFYRALGILEGITFAAEAGKAVGVCAAIEMLEASVEELADGKSN